MNILKMILSKIYGVAAVIKNFLYDAGILDLVHLKVPVISVGNLTVGGTGKTPFIHFLAKHFIELGFRPGIVSRSYRANLHGIHRVDPARPFAASSYGDEPVWLAEKLSSVPVYVGSLKWKTALHLEKNENIDVLLVDDGFQHRDLHRDLDLVLIDVTTGLDELELLPLGRGRESAKSLERADWVILSKINQTDPENLAKFMRLLPGKDKVVQVEHYLLGVPVDDAGKRVIAFSGLANNKNFFNTIKKETLYDVINSVEFRDHHNYTDLDIKALIEKKQKEGADLLVTTEKDWTKIKNILKSSDEIRVIGQQVRVQEPAEEFYVQLDRILSQNSQQYH